MAKAMYCCGLGKSRGAKGKIYKQELPQRSHTHRALQAEGNPMALGWIIFSSWSGGKDFALRASMLRSRQGLETVPTPRKDTWSDFEPLLPFYLQFLRGQEDACPVPGLEGG